MTAILAWLGAQAHVMASQVVIYTAVLAALLFLVPKIVKLVSK